MTENAVQVAYVDFFVDCTPTPEFGPGQFTLYDGPRAAEGPLRGFARYEEAEAAGLTAIQDGRANSFTIRKLYHKAGA